MPSIETESRTNRIASTAAWSAASLSPRPTQRAEASAATSVTRAISRARLRSGLVATDSVAIGSEDARRLARALGRRRAQGGADEHEDRPQERDEDAVLQRDQAGDGA